MTTSWTTTIFNVRLVIPMLSARIVLGPPQLACADGDNAPPRLLVLTDIGGDPDDQQSMVRLRVQANEFEIEGL